MHIEFSKMWALPGKEMDMHAIVKEYLVHCGFIETLQALEEKGPTIEDKKNS
jgi:hypothetical protein